MRNRIDEDKYESLSEQVAENAGHFETTTTGEY